MTYQSIRNINLSGKTVLVRVDYNVPIKQGLITSDFRIRASLPTLQFLRQQGAKKIILLSHLGRPDGQDPNLSLKVVADYLAQLIGQVSFIDAVTGPSVATAVKNLSSGGILLLENLRFFPGETENSPQFIQQIIQSTHADLFIQDAFSVLHRTHASVSAVAQYLPVYAGLLVLKELENLSSICENPTRPFLVIIGGSKVEDKSPLIARFSSLADHIVIGGKIATTGYQAQQSHIYVAEDFVENATGQKLDLGPRAIAKIQTLISESSTILWNGLLGYAEDPVFATASTIIARAIGRRHQSKTIICGGDTVGFVNQLLSIEANLKYSLLSTGGGATLDFLSSGSLPGLQVLQKNNIPH